MGIEMYAQLHGIAYAVHATAEEKSVLDSDIEAYADCVVEEEKAHYQGDPRGLESLETHTSRLRQQVIQAMHDYFDRLEHGYKAICDALKATGEPIPEVTAENLKIFNDVEAFMRAQYEGKDIYELLGFSPETLEHFYTALDGLFRQREFEKVRDSFYFMIKICPDIPLYWNQLGLAEVRLERFSQAQDAFLKSLTLDPTDSITYLRCLHAYEKQNKFAEAEALREQGIAYAQENRDADWSGELEQALVGANRELKADSKEEV